MLLPKHSIHFKFAFISTGNKIWRIKFSEIPQRCDLPLKTSFLLKNILWVIIFYCLVYSAMVLNRTKIISNQKRRLFASSWQSRCRQQPSSPCHRALWFALQKPPFGAVDIISLRCLFHSISTSFFKACVWMLQKSTKDFGFSQQKAQKSLFALLMGRKDDVSVSKQKVGSLGIASAAQAPLGFSSGVLCLELPETPKSRRSGWLLCFRVAAEAFWAQPGGRRSSRGLWAQTLFPPLTPSLTWAVSVAGAFFTEPDGSRCCSLHGCSVGPRAAIAPWRLHRAR